MIQLQRISFSLLLRSGKFTNKTATTSSSTHHYQHRLLISAVAATATNKLMTATTTIKMSSSSNNNKKNKKNAETAAAADNGGAGAGVGAVSGPIYVNKSNQICLSVFAKLGAKDTEIVNVDADAINVRIAAPPMDGEANKELLRFIAKFLGLRTSDVNLDKGSKNRNKVIVLSNCNQTVEQLIEKFQQQQK